MLSKVSTGQILRYHFLSDTGGQLMDWLSTGQQLENLFQLLENFLEAIRELLVNFWSTLSQLLVNLWSTLSQLLVKFESTLGQLWVNFESTFGQLLVNLNYWTRFPAASPILETTGWTKSATAFESSSPDLTAPSESCRLETSDR